MRMPTGVITECMDDENEARYPLIFAQGHLQKGGETFGRALTQLLQELTIVEEKLSNDLGNAENALPMGDRI